MKTITSLPSGFSALVIGASGGIGSAVADVLEQHSNCHRVIRLSRDTTPGFSLEDEGSIAAAAVTIAETTPRLDLVFNATGALVIDDVGPEKAIRALDPQAMAQQFAINAIGPALLIKHFSPLLPKKHRSLFGSITARVGSIGDNRLGGWISYRAAKAAQNQVIRTAAIELSRTRPLAVLAALHPGTVATSLSDPFAAGHDRLSPEKSAAMMLAVLDGLPPDQSGGFFAYDGNRIEW